MINILLIGHGAREHIVAETFLKNKEAAVFSYLKSKNPGILGLSEDFCIGEYNDIDSMTNFARKNEINFAFIGPEEPLSYGIVNSLSLINVPSIGPTKSLARIETSKSFTRNLLEKYKIEANPIFRIFNNKNGDEIRAFIDNIQEVVIKPDGLTSGKGVKVQNEHFHTKEEAYEYCLEVLKKHPFVVVEEKLNGEEFSLQCFTDGKSIVPMPAVQDHKRAYDDDQGPNTGGMGSYSYEKHLLPFLKKEDIQKAIKITKQVSQALFLETGQYYKGILYGGFILTKEGIKLLEYNARFGDPEAMNVLSVLNTDLVGICNAIIVQELGRLKINFEKKSTVCKYIVPKGYPTNPVKSKIIVNTPEKAKLYFGSVDETPEGLYMTGSRAIASIGIANNIEEAERIAEEGTMHVKGDVFHRKDIGTKELIQKKVEHIKLLTGLEKM